MNDSTTFTRFCVRESDTLLPLKETSTCTCTQYLEGEVAWAGSEKDISHSTWQLDLSRSGRMY
jgi:hypothetical protein